MIFASLPLPDCEGAILAHGVTVDGARFAKGRVLSSEDIQTLAQAGFQSITVARLEASDVEENQAAHDIAAKLLCPGLYASKAHTGRVNIFADKPGVLLIDDKRLETLNAVDEAITCATIHTPARVDQGQMVATIKIIPFAVEQSALEKALNCASIFDFRPFTEHNAALILTALPGMGDKLHQKAEKAVRARLEALGSRLDEVTVIPHTTEALQSAIAAHHEAGRSPILILGASATVDRRDTIPSAITVSGGTVHRFGMAVDPGNLLVLADFKNRPVIGLPGCARSPKLNGFDWVLERILAGIPIAKQDWAKMAHGGLLQEIESRPQPRLGKPKIAAIVLAAGQSRRMAGENKLLAEIAGKPLVRHSVEAALNSKAGDVYVVTGHMQDAVRAALSGLEVHFIAAPDYAKGMGRSLAAGIAALDASYQGALICLGDMPQVSEHHIDALISAWTPGAVAIATYAGKRGNPVLLPNAMFGKLKALTGDEGARSLIQEWPGDTQLIDMPDDAVLRDIDTKAELEQATARI